MKDIVSDSLFDIKKDLPILEERFGIPPFSILDTCQGYWRKRNSQWKKLGMRSELGRGDNLTFNIDFDIEKSKANHYGKAYDGLARDYGARLNQTSIFDPVLCELVYTWFMPKDSNKVLDCFAGGSVRGIVASVLGKEYTGIDLSESQIIENRKQFVDIGNEYPSMPMKEVNWIVGDSLNIDKLVDDKYDLLFSCPPYYDLEVYSDNPNDLSNMGDYSEFLDIYTKIIAKSCALLKDNSFAVFVVGEIRDKKGALRNFVGDTVEAFKKAGMNYYNEIILVNTRGSLPVRVSLQFNGSRKIGKTHQNVLVFHKGDMKNIKERFGEVVVEN